MGLIAIAANPASGRDIRRLVSYATVFNNREKQNIMERVILAAAQMGEHRFLHHAGQLSLRRASHRPFG